MKLRTAIAAIAAFAAGHVHAQLEIKGIAPGAPIASVDTKGCSSVADADSGFPGFRCQTTFGGAPVELRLAVYEERVLAVVINAPGSDASPVLGALEEKFGKASQPNRYIREFRWFAGDGFLSLEEFETRKGYSLILLDRAASRRADESRKRDAKKDL